MVQRVELVPASVRCYGDIVSPKLVGDFETFNCSLSKSDDVFSMVYGAGVVSVALAVSPATVTYGQSVVLEATVLEDDNPLEGVTVQFFDGNSVLGTDTSDVNGVASLTVSDLSVGSHSINAQYDSESSNIVPVTVNVPYTDITLTSTKDILSYANGDSATLTVRLVDGQGSAVAYAGESVTFEVRKVSDDSLVETLTPGETDSSGVATTAMSSRGTGDVYIKAECSLVSKLFTIEDCIRYDSNSYLGDATATTKTVSLGYDLPTHFKVEYEYKITSLSEANSSVLWIGTSNGNAILFNRISGNDTIYKLWVRTNSSGSGDIKHDGSSITVSNDFQSFFITYDGSEVNYNNMITVTNLNGVTLSKLYQLSGSHQTSQQGIIRNIKIKPL